VKSAQSTSSRICKWGYNCLCVHLCAHSHLYHVRSPVCSPVCSPVSVVCVHLYMRSPLSVMCVRLRAFASPSRSLGLSWESSFRKSRWFKRGWTLQELIAPALVEFFSKEGEQLGSKRSLERHVHEVTGIPIKALRGSPLSDFSVPERILWAEDRDTTHKAYSLLGIFDVHMPLIYGEGREKAFKRLRGEIDRASRGSLVPIACVSIRRY
jgi:hypothetical protein